MAEAVVQKYEINSDFYEDEDFGSFMVLRSVSTPEIQSPSRNSPSPSDKQDDFVASVFEAQEKAEGEETQGGSDLKNNDKYNEDSLKGEGNSFGANTNKSLEVDFFSISSYGINSGNELVSTSSSGGVTTVENQNSTSVTSDASSSTTSVDSQIEEMQSKINHLIQENLGLQACMTKVNEEMEKNVLIVEQQTLSWNTERKEHQLEFRQCQEYIKTLQEENNALKRLKESDSKKFQIMESMLAMDKVKDDKTQELIETLAAERRQMDNLKQLLSHKDEILQKNADYISRLDAAALYEKGKFASKLEAFEKQKAQLEDDRLDKKRVIDELKQQLEAANSVCEDLKMKNEGLLSKYEESEEHLKQNENMRMELLARKAEYEEQVDLFRYNIHKEKSEKNRLQCEFDKLMEEHNAVKATVEELSIEINQNVEGLSASLPNSTSGADRNSSHGQNQDGFEHVKNLNSSPSSGLILFAQQEIFECPFSNCKRRFSNQNKLRFHASECEG